MQIKKVHDHTGAQFEYACENFETKHKVVQCKSMIEKTSSQAEALQAQEQSVSSELGSEKSRIAAIEESCFAKSSTHEDYLKFLAQNTELEKLKSEVVRLEYSLQKIQMEVSRKASELEGLNSSLSQVTAEAKKEQSREMTLDAKEALLEMKQHLQNAAKSSAKFRGLQIGLATELDNHSPLFDMHAELQVPAIDNLIRIVNGKLSGFPADDVPEIEKKQKDTRQALGV